MNFAKRSGKDEMIRLAGILSDVELPERCDAFIGMISLIIVQMIRSTPQDAAASMHQLARLMGGEE